MRLTLASVTLLFQAFSAFPREHADADNKISDVQKLVKAQANAVLSAGGVNRRRLYGNRMQRSLLRAQAHRNSRDLSLKNKVSNHVTTMKECNPISEDADVGILSCGRGQYCKPNESSELGGVCSAVERKLFFGYIPNSCPKYCNCTVSSKSNTGYITCPYFYCGTFCLNQTICAYETKTQYFVKGVAGNYEDCFYFSKPYRVSSCYISSGNKCTYKIDNVTCNYCHQGGAIDCTNVPKGQKSGYSLPIVTAWNRQGGPFCTPTAPPPVPPPTPPPVPPPTPLPVPPPTPPPTRPACAKLHEECSNQPCCSTFDVCRMREVGSLPLCSAPNEATSKTSLASQTFGGAAGRAKSGN